MNVFIIHAHNEPQSFTTALKDLSVDILEQQGHQVRVSDLYAMKFNPVASGEDFKQRTDSDYLVYAKEQRNGYKTDTLADDIAAEIEKVKWADLIIFNFPLYWYSLPAIMKGWIDRVFISGYCYGGTRIYDRGGLKGKQAMLTFSLGGREHMFGPNAIHGELDTMLRPITRGILGYVGLSVLPPFIAYHVPYIDQQARQDVLEQYHQHLLTLDQRTPLSFPSLDNFDEQLNPIN